MKPFFVALVGLASLIYLLNPTAGLFELIPDNFPLIGNLDEATACALALAALRYFGLDLTAFLRTKLDDAKPRKDNK
jgi:uncharacterized membrane protein YkvA (DUF1232 family)|tara:strand:+ start:363 stop:593 length:231 start_codon:yes stop_codon:yes gene_type:complete